MLKKLWHDPVWSKVIATIVVGIPATIAYFLNWWPWILHWLAEPVRFLGRTSVIPAASAKVRSAKARAKRRAK